MNWSIACAAVLLASPLLVWWRRHCRIAAASQRLYAFWMDRLVAPREWHELQDQFPQKKDWLPVIADHALVRKHPRYADQLPPQMWDDFRNYPWVSDPRELDKMSS